MLVLVLVPVLRRVGGTAAVGTAALVFVLDAGVGVGVGTVEAAAVVEGVVGRLVGTAAVAGTWTGAWSWPGAARRRHHCQCYPAVCHRVGQHHVPPRVESYV